MNTFLALDTSTSTLTVALSHGETVLLRHQDAPRQHGQLLLPWIDELLQEAGVRLSDLSAIFCGIGPGGFTGIRTGVCAAQAMAVAHELPVVGVSSLQIIAQAAFDGHDGRNGRVEQDEPDEPGTLSMRGLSPATTGVLVAQDARMGEVYWAGYVRDDEGLAVAEVADQLRAPELVAMPALTRPWVAVGDAWSVYPEALAVRTAGLGELEKPDVAPHALALLRLGTSRLAAGLEVAPEQLLPQYLRGQEAWKKHPIK